MCVCVCSKKSKTHFLRMKTMLLCSFWIAWFRQWLKMSCIKAPFWIIAIVSVICLSATTVKKNSNIWIVNRSKIILWFLFSMNICEYKQTHIHNNKCSKAITYFKALSCITISWMKITSNVFGFLHDIGHRKCSSTILRLEFPKIEDDSSHFFCCKRFQNIYLFL